MLPAVVALGLGLVGQTKDGRGSCCHLTASGSLWASFFYQHPHRRPHHHHPTPLIRLLLSPCAVQLQAMGLGDLGVSMGGPDYSGGTFEDPVPKRGGSRMRDVPSFDSLDQVAAEAPKRAPVCLCLGCGDGWR